jgi:hypothetical protein
VAAAVIIRAATAIVAKAWMLAVRKGISYLLISLLINASSVQGCCFTAFGGQRYGFFLNEQKFSLLFRCYRLAVWGFCRNFAAQSTISQIDN